MISPSSLRKALILLTGSIALFRGEPGWTAPIEKVPYRSDAPPEAETSSTSFTPLGPDVTRISYSHDVLNWHPFGRLYATSFACGNTALGDLDLDGFTDLFISGGPGPNKIYLQAERLSFVDVTAGLEMSDGDRWAGGSVMVDLDNDGDLDIYVCFYEQPNQLYVNQFRESGRLWFQERAKDFGLDICDASLVPAFADYDQDGDLDLYLVTHQLVRENGRPSTPVKLEKDATGNGLRITGDLSRYFELDDPTGDGVNLQYHETGRPDRLLRNDKGKFHDVTRSAGIDESPFIGNSAVWWDADGDGFPDLYVANEGPDPDLFFRNKGDGTFVSDPSALPRTPVNARGATVLDADSDGFTDLLVSDIHPDTHFKRQVTLSPQEEYPIVRWHPDRGAPQASGNALFLGGKTPRFRETAWLGGIAATGWTSTVKAGDFDQDGREDLFFTTGAVRNFKMADLPRLTHDQLVGKSVWEVQEALAPEKREGSRAFRNTGGGRFTEVSGPWGLAQEAITCTCSQADLDNDGDLDLVVARLGEPLTIYRNDGAKGNSVRIRLRGTRSNIQGIGARVILTTPKGQQVRELRCGGGFLDADEASLHFGIGNLREVPQVEVIWPGGCRQKFTKLAANHLYLITEEQQSPVPPAPVSLPAPWFVADAALNSCRHQPSASPALSQQPLLPFSLHTTGPAQAWGDVDGDGDLDLQMGNAVVYRQTTQIPGEWRFEIRQERSLEQDEAVAEGGAVLLDVDADGDLDLYQASAPSPSTGASTSPQGRLLMNWERGFMGLEPGRWPETPSPFFAVCAADMDRDGDTDVFAGGLWRPGNYPLSTGSGLFLNDKGIFREASSERAPALASTGLVTSAVWTDLDGDGWLDLLLALEWGPLRVLQNRQGQLVPASGNGLEGFEGRWCGVASADLDGDGDLDVIATNLGLNTPYQASPKSPALLFHGTFGGMTEPRLIEALLEQGVCFPRRNLTDLSSALPFLQANWKSHRDFASAPLNQLIPMKELEAASLFRATEFRSGIFWNDGKARFQFSPLPQEAQLAPAFGVAAADVDLDGSLDLFVAQGLSSARPGMGPFRGGFSTLLSNHPRAPSPQERFSAWTPAQSGLAIPGDARSAAFVDANGDSYPDLVVGSHGAPLALFLHRGQGQNAPLTVTLRGAPGNPTAIGARVQVKIPGLPLQTREVQAGSGYLTSVHGGSLFFARTANPTGTGLEVLVRWPLGEERSYRFPDGTAEIVLDQERKE